MRAVPTDGMPQWLMKLSLQLPESYEAGKIRKKKTRQIENVTQIHS